jgi:hypothetical protein
VNAEPRDVVPFVRRAAAWSLAWILSGAIYLLLIDTTSLPELLVGAGAAALAATGFELVREQHIAGETVRLSWLRKMHRPFVRIVPDVAMVSFAALRQLVRREPEVGVFRAVRFACGEEEQLESGRRSLAEGFGSVAPNTVIVGVDGDRELLLAHQLKSTGGPEAIDLLELG